MKTILKIAVSVGIVLCFSFLNDATAQTNLIIAGGNVNISGNYLILNNTKLTNDGTLGATAGTVTITGTATEALSAISGTSLSSFYNLTINKSSNNALLDNDINISNQLTLTNGNIDIQGNDLTILNTATISGGSSNSFIKTTGVGILTQEVSASNVVFPIGKQSYTPVTLNNAGTTDDFKVRVENIVYLDGTSGTVLTTDVVDATWYIDEVTSGGSNVTLTFQWNTSDELTDFDRTQSFITHYDNSMWNNGTQQTASGSNPYTLSTANVTAFSPFSIASDATVLPVELLYFYGEKAKNGVLLSWETATEINNDYFDVEWSTDGISFEKIGQVKGAGTTMENQSYEFLHTPDLSGLYDHYYRLKQVDFDEKFEYSNIINIQTIEPSNHQTIKIYPNPVRYELTITNTEKVENIVIYNSIGQIVKQLGAANSQLTVDVSDLPEGIYTLKLQNTNGSIVTKQFIK
jgi:hypothetical protein